MGVAESTLASTTLQFVTAVPPRACCALAKAASILAASDVRYDWAEGPGKGSGRHVEPYVIGSVPLLH